MQTIYVHIGTPKTGTTYLQQYFSQNRAKFLEHGLYYLPDSHGVNALGIATGLGFWEERDPRAHVDSVKWFRSELRAAMASKVPRILISSEMFCETTVANRLPLVRRLHRELAAFRPGRIVVVCYLRRQDHFIESRQANDIVHWGISPAVATVDPSLVAYADYYKLLSDYRRVFGDNIVVRPYEKGQWPNGDLLTDFLGLLGMTKKRGYTDVAPESDPNTRVRGDLTEMVRLYNLSGLNEERPDYAFMRHKFLPALFSQDQLSLRRAWGHRFLALSKRKRAEVLKRYAAGNRKVAVEFLRRKNGQLFLESLKPALKDRFDGRPLQVEEITPIFMHMLTRLFEDTEPLPAQVASLNERDDHIAGRIGSLEKMTERVAAIEQRAARVSAIEEQLGRLDALEQQASSVERRVDERLAQRGYDDRLAGLDRAVQNAGDRAAELEAALGSAQARHDELQVALRSAQDQCAALEAERRLLEWKLVAIASSGKKIIGWGTAAGFTKNYAKNPAALAYLVDNNPQKWGTKRRGLAIQPPDALEREVPADVMIVVYADAFDEIARQIALLGNFTAVPGEIFAKYGPRTSRASRAPQAAPAVDAAESASATDKFAARRRQVA